MLFFSSAREPLSPGSPAKLQWPLLLLLLFMVLLFVLAYWLDTRRRKKEKDFFRAVLAVREKRDTSRLILPPSCSVQVTLTDPVSFGWRCRVLDLSPAGLAVEPDFPLRRLPLQQPWHNVLLQTSWTTVVIRTIEPVRFEHRAGRRLLGLKIAAIDDDQRLLWLNLVKSIQESADEEA